MLHKKLLLIALLIVGYLYADVQLVNDSRFILLKEGQLFSINEDNKKYEFQSIDFELELINHTIDIKHINKIIIYKSETAYVTSSANSDFEEVMSVYNDYIPFLSELRNIANNQILTKK